MPAPPVGRKLKPLQSVIEKRIIKANKITPTWSPAANIVKRNALAAPVRKAKSAVPTNILKRNALVPGKKGKTTHTTDTGSRTKGSGGGTRTGVSNSGGLNTKKTNTKKPKTKTQTITKTVKKTTHIPMEENHAGNSASSENMNARRDVVTVEKVKVKKKKAK